MTQAQLEKLIREGHTPKYGFLFAPLRDAKGKPLRVNGRPVPMPGWLIEKHIYNGFRVPGYKGQAWHFMRFVDELWGDKSDKDGLFEWNPNAVRMIENTLKHRLLAVCGCASSGKSNFIAMSAVAMFLLNPEKSKCLVTSMTIATAESKVWGWVEAYWNRAMRKVGANQMPGVLTSSNHIIRRRLPDGKLSRLQGVELVPADKSEYKKSATKLQGFKTAGGGDLWMFADELDTLSPSLLNTCRENLSANDGFRMVAGFNPTSHFTPGGLFATPKHGWKSIDIDTHEWETEDGYCIRFDGLRSPNVLEGKAVWSGLLSLEALNGFRERFQGNENSPGFVSMVRGFFSASGNDETVLSEVEIENYEANRRTSTWMDRGVMIAGLDPAFCHDGDLAVLTIGRVGMAMDNDLGVQKKVCERIKTYVLDSDVKASKDKSEQVVEQVKNKLIEHNVATEDLAVDISGAASFGSLLARDIGAGFLHVNFGGSPSETRVSASDKRTGKEAYVNKATELWMSLKPLVRSGQIKGLDPDTIVELTTRTCKATASGRSEIESKKKMKQRTNGASPDCFIAGTKVLTSHGEKNIEDIMVGDMVVTPFGQQPVVLIHKTESDDIWMAKFNNGKTLTGKGDHKIFTWENGWVKMKDLSLTNTIESDRDVKIWNILNSLFTRKENIGFKALVDTIKTDQGVRLKDFYTGLSGLKIMGQFRRVFASIIKMATGLTIELKTWSYCQLKAICAIMQKRDGLIPIFQPECSVDSKRQSSRLCIGTKARRGWNGTSSMGKTFSGTGRTLKTHAPSVAQFSRAGSQGQPCTAQNHAETGHVFAGLLRIKERALSAALNLFAAGTLKIKPVRVLAAPSLLPELRKTVVYNLTLLEENAYYANGILAQNCADALVLMAEVARQKHGLIAIERPAKPAKKPSKIGTSIYHQVYDMGEEPKHKTRIKVPDFSWQEDSWQGIGSGGWDE